MAAHSFFAVMSEPSSTMAEVCKSEVPQCVHQGWELQQQQQSSGRPDTFTKRVLRGSLHLLPQSAICVPTYFVQAHLETFQAGNVITLEGPSKNTWRVRTTGKPILQSGWRAFAHDNGLREGDELQFTLTQPPFYFVVAICNRRGAVKALTAVNTGKYSATRPGRSGPRKRTFHEENIEATIASRCKTTVRERGGYMLRFSEERKLWNCRDDRSGREVVTIFDSEDDKFELTFGSAQFQSYRTSKAQRMLGYAKTQKELFPPPGLVTAVATHTQTCHIVDLNELIPDQDQDMVMSESLPQSDHGQSQIKLESKHANEETMMSEREAWHLLQSNHEQSQITLESKHANEETMISAREAWHALESNHEQSQITLETKHADQETMMSEREAWHVLQSNHGTVQIQTIPREEVQQIADEDNQPLANGTETPADGLFESLQNIVDMPVISETKIGPVHQRSVPLVSHQRSVPLVSHQRSVPLVSTAKLNLGGQSSTTACVLKSKRMPVSMLYRAKTLQAARAMTTKMRTPNFVAVMKKCNVYSGFSMDVPVGFARRARLPAAEARVLLVCDEVPTMTRAIWMGTNPANPKLDARAWMDFSRSHFLEEGDVCVFELFNRAPIRIGIHIFRAASLKRVLLPIDWTQHYHVVHALDAPQPCPTSGSATTPLTLT